MIGKSILHYKILSMLGEGGMGVVYRAEDTKIKREVAIKFLPRQIAASDEERERFKIEAQAAGALNHSNIATIYAIEESDDETFIVMEYIKGQELKNRIDAGPLPIDDTIDIAIQIAKGLQAAHSKDVIHRDIKAANIMLTEEGAVKIMDFGLAKRGGQTKLTKEGTTLGTVAYMSPEQTRGEDVDQRSDIFSLGVLLSEMLTGQLPFKGDYDQAVTYSILNEEPEPVTGLRTGIPMEVERIVGKCLKKEASDRYQHAEELIVDLRVVGDDQSSRGKSSAETARTRQSRRRPAVPWVIAAVVVVLALITVYQFISASKTAETDVKTIAVLPFADMSPNKDQEYFSDGIAEELLNVLAKNTGLRVTSRTSAFSFKGTNTDIRTIAEKLNVQHILEGSVRKDDNSLRITAQLIDVVTDAHLWSQTYDGTLDNIFAVQDTISRSVAEALNVTLLGGETQTVHVETSPEAYNAYLQGEHFSKMRTKEGLKKAIGYHGQALSIDPNYARAWAGLSGARIRQADRGYVQRDEGYRKARRELQKALELNSNLTEAHVQMGWINKGYDWDWTAADAAFQRALKLEPGNVSAVRGAAALAATLGRFEQTLALGRRAIELDPVSVIARYSHGLYAWYASQLDEAEVAFRKALELNPQFWAAHAFLGFVYLEKGNPDSALAEIEKQADPVWRKFGLAVAYHALGSEKEAEAALAAYIQEYQDGWAYQIAEIYAYRGETDKAFEWLERAYNQRDSGLAEMKGDPLLRNIEKDSRYAEFLRKMKLPQ